MRTVVFTSQFKRDLKRMRKRGKDLNKIAPITDALQKDKKLPAKKRDHLLTGSYQGRRECHIEPDWLLIYQLKENKLILERTGSHSDVFLKNVNSKNKKGNGFNIPLTSERANTQTP